MNFGEHNAPYCLIMREKDTNAMNGFLVRVTYLEQRMQGAHRLLVSGLGRFSAARVYKEEDPIAPEEQEESKEAMEARRVRQMGDLWIAEGQLLHDVNRFDLIAQSEAQMGAAEGANPVERLKQEYRRKLESGLKQLIEAYKFKFEQKLKAEAKLRGNGGVRAENALKANITATFGNAVEDVNRRFMRPGAAALGEQELFELAEAHSLFILSTLEF